MKNRSGHLAIIGGLVATAMVSLGGAVAWSRANSPGRIDTPASAEPKVAIQPQRAVRPLRDLAAIKSAQVPLASLSRNPFRNSADATVKPASESTRPQLLAALQTMRLDSVLVSDTLRSCTINGRALSEGDTVRPFTIEKINSNSVTLKNGLYRFELRVQQ